MKQLYIVEKIKNKWYVNLFGYSVIIFIFLLIFILLTLSFLFNTSEFTIGPLTLMVIIGANIVQIIIFIYYFNFRTSSNKAFSSNIASGGVDTARVYGPLDENQKSILTKQHNLSYSMYRAFWFLIPLFVLFDIFLTYAIFRNGATLFTIAPSLIAFSLQVGMIRYGMRHSIYYADLISPLFHTTGELNIFQQKNSYTIVVNDVRMPIDYNMDTDTINKIYNLKNGQIVHVIYSPNSKYIWEIETVEKNS